MSGFILTKRGDLPNYYVSFKNPLTGKYGTKRCTGTSDRKQAEKIAYQWLVSDSDNDNKKLSTKNLLDAIKFSELTIDDTKQIVELLQIKGLVVSAVLKEDKSDIPLIAFLENFWTAETSPYIKEKLRKQHGIHKRYITKQYGAIKNYWKPFFKDVKLGSLTRDDINKFIDWMGLSPTPSTSPGKNAMIKAGTLALRWAARNGYLPHDITQGLMFFSGENNKREILTPELAAAVFQRPWKNPTSKLANLLAMCTGMRAGEIQGLRKQDLGKSCLYIRHSWNFDDGLKTTKNNENRIAEIVFPELMGAIIDQANSNPYEEGLEGYVFWASIPNKPCESKIWLADLREVCKEIGINDPSWVTFHAWRHFFATYMHGKVQDKVLQMATGHKTNAMLQHYANHTRLEDINELKEAQKSVFEPILGKIIDL
ncbi:tyrosine-type recombinase/integrase [Treponema zuelzerae]|uniref:Tyrosine-type recombinase/integrase n=1 Tax=Teretinema zuelzerae TaxID=156 RepID=A0AAE3EFG8_9SPIR|nr:tyrosine-type recombinase/integrase [Teretinema zuelzerae]MCD1653507.1 tyrosine-type recombinase/integrase [Teretinema zuelzerae]